MCINASISVARGNPKGRGGGGGPEAGGGVAQGAGCGSGPPPPPWPLGFPRATEIDELMHISSMYPYLKLLIYLPLDY